MIKSDTHLSYYQILEVHETASSQEIKKAYLKLANDYHPDKLGHVSEAVRKLSEAKLKEINEAYEILKDPEKKKVYDQDTKRKTDESTRSELIQQIQDLHTDGSIEEALKMGKKLHDCFPDDDECINIYAFLACQFAALLTEEQMFASAESYLEIAISITTDEELKQQIRKDLDLVKSYHKKWAEEREEDFKKEKELENKRRREETERYTREIRDKNEKEKARIEAENERLEKERRLRELPDRTRKQLIAIAAIIVLGVVGGICLVISQNSSTISDYQGQQTDSNLRK
jgi:curved DNA-binding protein CbpA